MSLDKSYFNSIRLDTFRHKFYSVEAVDRLLVDIRSQADSMNREMEASAKQLVEAQKTVESLTEENKDLLSKGQALSQEIISLREDLKAAEAVVVDKEALRAEIIGQANAEANELLSSAQSEAEQRITVARSEAEQCLASAKAEAEQILSAARSEAEQRIASARAEAEKCVTEASAEAEEMRSEADAEAQSVRYAAKAEREKLLRRVRLQCENSAVALEEAFSTAREYHSESLTRVDNAWKQLLRSLPEGEEDEETPPDLAAKINRIVQELEDLESV